MEFWNQGRKKCLGKRSTGEKGASSPSFVVLEHINPFFCLLLCCCYCFLYAHSASRFSFFFLFAAVNSSSFSFHSSFCFAAQIQVSLCLTSMPFVASVSSDLRNSLSSSSHLFFAHRPVHFDPTWNLGCIHFFLCHSCASFYVLNPVFLFTFSCVNLFI